MEGRNCEFASLMDRLISGQGEEATAELVKFLRSVVAGKADPVAVSACLAAMSHGSMSPAMAAAFVRFIEMDATTSALLGAEPWNAVNIVGSGGGLPTFNISSTAAVIAAAAGTPVLKSGSAAYCSRSGSVDWARSAGIPLVESIAEARSSLLCHGIAFYAPGSFSPLLKRLAFAVLPHPLKLVAPVLNHVGPLIRTLPAKGQLTGLSSLSHLDWYTEAFQSLGRFPVVLVANAAHMDEGSTFCPNVVRRIHEDTVDEFVIDPDRYGFGPVDPSALCGGNAAENVQLSQDIFECRGTPAVAEIAVLNAALLIWTADETAGLPDAVGRAWSALKGGQAAALFATLRTRPALRRAG